MMSALLLWKTGTEAGPERRDRAARCRCWRTPRRSPCAVWAALQPRTRRHGVVGRSRSRSRRSSHRLARAHDSADVRASSGSVGGVRVPSTQRQLRDVVHHGARKVTALVGYTAPASRASPAAHAHLRPDAGRHRRRRRHPHFTIASYRRLGIVPQDPFLFQGTVSSNIRYGKLGATDAEVETAIPPWGLRPAVRCPTASTTGSRKMPTTSHPQRQLIRVGPGMAGQARPARARRVDVAARSQSRTRSSSRCTLGCTTL